MTSCTFLILVLFLELPAALCAQKGQGSWSDLRGLWVETQNIQALSDGLATRSQRELTRSSGHFVRTGTLDPNRLEPGGHNLLR